jgi:hypothetical protein
MKESPTYLEFLFLSLFSWNFHALVLADEVSPLFLLIFAPFISFSLCRGSCIYCRDTLLVGSFFLENHLMGRIEIETRNEKDSHIDTPSMAVTLGM